MEPRKFILRSEFVRKHLIEFLSKLDLGTLIEVTVQEFEERRTNAQNDRMWKLHRLAGSAVGCTAEDMHEDTLCQFYGYREVRMLSGHIKRVPLETTSRKGKRWMSDHMQRLEAFYISELGVWLDREAA